MLYDCGLLSGLALRQSHPVFSRVNRWIGLRSLTREAAWELAVLLRTRGFGFDHHAYAFGWLRDARLKVIPVITDYFADHADVEAAATANGDSVTLEDGLAYVYAILATKPRYRGSVPLWTTLALQSWRDQGATVAEMAARLGPLVKASSVTAWITEQRFDPLSGCENRW